MYRGIATVALSLVYLWGAEAAHAEPTVRQQSVSPPAQAPPIPSPPAKQPQAAKAPSKTKEILTDAAIAAAIIAASIAAYRAGAKGPCACPSDVDRAGHSCGKRSAHDRPGGWTVYCSAADVTKEMIDAYRRQKAN
jgi:hypothetical protein